MMSRKEPTRKKKIFRLALCLEKFLGIPERPARSPEPLEMLVATILSQNTNDLNSHRAYTSLRKRYPAWKDLADAPTRQIISAIRSGGMAETKGKRIKYILRSIHASFGEYSLDRLKREEDETIMNYLLQLDGVGVKTAACVLLFSMARDVFPVDTHIHRIIGRLGLSPGSKIPEDTFHDLQRVIPAGKAYSFHTNLIRFGRKICKAAGPLCGECPLYSQCPYELKSARRMKISNGKSRQNVEFMLLDNI